MPQQAPAVSKNQLPLPVDLPTAPATPKTVASPTLAPTPPSAPPSPFAQYQADLLRSIAAIRSQLPKAPTAAPYLPYDNPSAITQTALYNSFIQQANLRRHALYEKEAQPYNAQILGLLRAYGQSEAQNAEMKRWEESFAQRGQAEQARERQFEDRLNTEIGIEGMRERAADRRSLRAIQARGLGGLGQIPGNPALTGEAYLHSLPPSQALLVRDIGTGRMPLERYGYMLTRNPGLLASVSQAYPDFDGSKIESYIEAMKKFTSGSQAMMMNAGGTVLRHLQELKRINDQNPETSRIHGTAANVAFKNLLNTLTGELIRFYGMPDTNEQHKKYEKSLGGMFSRDSGITTQAHAIADKLASLAQTWSNAAPSAAYQAKMPSIDNQARIALHALDPSFNYDYPGITNLFAPSGAVNNYRFKAHNKAGHVIGSNDQVHWFDLATGQPIRAQ